MSAGLPKNGKVRVLSCHNKPFMLPEIQKKQANKKGMNMAIEKFSVNLEVLDKEIGYYKTAINELKTNPNACKVPPAIFSETELSPIMNEFFIYTVWYSEFDLPKFDGDIDTLIP